jgi:acyl-CoA synthetase (NDP forming)
MSLASETTRLIDAVFFNASQEGRSTLHEHEVYALLSALGLDVPFYRFVKTPEEVTGAMLSRFPGGSVMVKTVSRDLSHNQRFGGVKKVASADPLFVRYVMHSMREEVLGHFPVGEKPRIDGFLVVEFAKFTQALGNEILIGLKDDGNFGPVLTLSKGGDDAEFFSKYYDPANLFLAPISAQEARDAMRNIKIRHKFADAGHPEYIDHIVESLVAIGELGAHYAPHPTDPPAFFLRSFDVNPFVFTEDSRFIAVDGFAEFEPAASSARRQRRRGAVPESFFAPKGIAVIGVSHDTSKYNMARMIVDLLLDLGRDDLFLVNPKGGSVSIGGKEWSLYSNLADIDAPYDLVVYAAPGKSTLSFLAEVPEGKAVVVVSGIPGDMNYSEFSQRVHEMLPRRTRVIGPNGMGVFYAPGEDSLGVNTLFIGEERLKLGYGPMSNAALLTQSGGMAISFIERTQFAPIFKAIVSFGNKVDVDFPDLVEFFSERKGVDVMSLYVEGLDPGEGRRFFDVAKRSTKPLIVYKSGRTEAGVKAAASHTASMTGSYEVFQAACLQAGVVLTEDLSDFYNYTKAFSMLSHKKPHGRRVAGIVNAGLDATMGADTLNYISQAVFTPRTVERIKALNTHGLVDTSTSFLDLTPMTGDVMFAGFVEAALADEGVDCVFIAVVPHIENLKTMGPGMNDPDALGPLLAGLGKKYDKPVVVSVNAGGHYQDFIRKIEESGLPVFGDIRSAIRALDAFVEYWDRRADHG